jgi:hypothetical protein
MLDDNQRKAFLDWLVGFATEESRTRWLQVALQDPKILIWLSMIRVIVYTSLTSMKATLERQLSEFALKKIQVEE